MSHTNYETDSSSVTQEVQDYVLFYQHKGVLYRIHLIDSPGFDDGNVQDSENLNKIATFINVNYRLKKRLAGVLYLHDITKGKMGDVGTKNLRMLEGMIGQHKYNNCTFVTTKWGCSNRTDEEFREKTLTTSNKYFGNMLECSRHADMKRFYPKSKGVALDIIKPYLDNDFTTQLSEQMVGPGSKLALGNTDAGKVIMEDIQKLAHANEKIEETRRATKILSQEFDEALFQEFAARRKKLRNKILLQKTGRWVMRTTIIGGAIVATALTLGPGAAAFVLEPAYERAIMGQRQGEKQAKIDLQNELRRRAARGDKLKDADETWLWDTNVRNLKDVESYSIRNPSSEDIMGIVQQGAHVGIATTDPTTDPLKIKEFDEDDEFTVTEESESDESDFVSKETDVLDKVLN